MGKGTDHSSSHCCDFSWHLAGKVPPNASRTSHHHHRLLLACPGCARVALGAILRSSAKLSHILKRVIGPLSLIWYDIKHNSIYIWFVVVH